MSPGARERVRALASRLFGERPLPVGDVARDRRVLRRVLTGRPPGRVLVVGRGLPVRQALPGVAVDVAGTSPHLAEVNVCSSVTSTGSLPRNRWDTVVVSEPGPDPAGRLQAVVAACRPGGRLLLLDRTGWVPALPSDDRSLLQVVHEGRSHRVWAGEVSR